MKPQTILVFNFALLLSFSHAFRQVPLTGGSTTIILDNQTHVASHPTTWDVQEYDGICVHDYRATTARCSVALHDACVCYNDGHCEVRETNKCLECRDENVYSVVHEYDVCPIAASHICRRSNIAAPANCPQYAVGGCICYNEGDCEPTEVNACVDCQRSDVWAVFEHFSCPWFDNLNTALAQPSQPAQPVQPVQPVPVNQTAQPVLTSQANQTNQTAQANQTNQTAQANQTGQSVVTTQQSQTNQTGLTTNQTNQTAQTTNQTNQTAQTANQTNQTVQTTNQTNQTANQTNQTALTSNQTEQTNGTDTSTVNEGNNNTDTDSDNNNTDNDTNQTTPVVQPVPVNVTNQTIVTPQPAQPVPAIPAIPIVPVVANQTEVTA